MLVKELLEQTKPKPTDVMYIDLLEDFYNFDRSKTKTRKEWQDMHAIVAEYSEMKKSKKFMTMIGELEVAAMHRTPKNDGYLIVINDTKESKEEFANRYKGLIVDVWQTMNF